MVAGASLMIRLSVHLPAETAAWSFWEELEARVQQLLWSETAAFLGTDCPICSLAAELFMAARCTGRVVDTNVCVHLVRCVSRVSFCPCENLVIAEHI